jgi:HKD family nuclease
VLIVQDPAHPNRVFEALVGFADAGATRVRVLAAYTTLAGCELLVPALAEHGALERGMTVITSFDYGITEPEALEYLKEHDVVVRIANLGEGGAIAVRPGGSAYHAKAYLFDSDESTGVLVGSANLTRRALTVNVEAVYAASDADAAVVDEQWDLAYAASVAVTPDLLEAYRALRPAQLGEPRDEREPLPPTPMPRVGQLRTFADAYTDGDTDPAEFNAMWVEAGSMSSSASHAQLELPRHASMFFGFAFDQYDNLHHLIGYPQLHLRGSTFHDRRLTWHGDNRMERINLPTYAQSGVRYPGTAIIFRRVDDGFAVQVRPWDSTDAEAWRQESAAAGTMYRLGQASNRMCGLL